MKNLQLYINEKLKINKDTRFSNRFEITDTNRIIEPKDWTSGRVAFMCKYAKEYRNENKKNLSQKKLDFIQKWYLTGEMIHDEQMRGHKYPSEMMEWLNGNPPFFENVKFIYDLVNWVLENKKNELTKPRLTKLNKMLRKISSHIDKIKELTWGEEDSEEEYI